MIMNALPPFKKWTIVARHPWRQLTALFITANSIINKNFFLEKHSTKMLG